MTAQTDNTQVTDVTYCSRHPEVETSLSCGRCGTYICPRCMVMTPVGARCRDCAQLRRLPTYNVPPVFFVRAYAASLVAGGALGAVWGYIFGSGGGGFGFFSIFIGAILGFALARAINLATNYKRGPFIQASGVLGMVVAYLVHNIVGDGALIVQGDIRGFVALAVGAFLAWSQLR